MASSRLRLIAVVIAAQLLFVPSLTAVAQQQVDPQWKLVWSDEFETDGAPDKTKWGFELGFERNHESQFYTDRRENSRIENGLLVIEARKERVPNPRFQAGHRDWRRQRAESTHTSAALVTRGKASWTYGRVEVRAQLPMGRGTWPAIWMLGVNRDEVGWPKCGEIDIMEFVGFEPNRIHANVHMEKYNHVRGTGKGSTINSDDLANEFHLYRLDWHQDRLEFYFDDLRYFVFAKEADGPDVWPFSQPHYLLLNLAIGGDWGGREGIEESIFPARFLIDYVRVYQQVPSVKSAPVRLNWLG